MPFDEWFEQEFSPQFAYINDDPYNYRDAAYQAWEASRTACITECEIAVDNVMDQSSYSITPVRLRYFKMGAKAALRDFKVRLR